MRLEIEKGFKVKTGFFQIKTNRYEELYLLIMTSILISKEFRKLSPKNKRYGYIEIPSIIINTENETWGSFETQKIKKTELRKVYLECKKEASDIVLNEDRAILKLRIKLNKQCSDVEFWSNPTKVKDIESFFMSDSDLVEDYLLFNDDSYVSEKVGTVRDLQRDVMQECIDSFAIDK